MGYFFLYWGNVILGTKPQMYVMGLKPMDGSFLKKCEFSVPGLPFAQYMFYSVIFHFFLFIGQFVETLNNIKAQAEITLLLGSSIC